MNNHAMAFAISSLCFAAPLAAAGTKAEVCQKVGNVMGPHLEATKNVATELTVMRISGEAEARERAERIFDMVSENQRQLIMGLNEIVKLCSDD